MSQICKAEAEGDVHGPKELILITDMDMKTIMHLWIESIFIFLTFELKDFNVKVQNMLH